MYELIPLAAGLGLGVFLLSVQSMRLRVAIGAAVSLVVGVAAATIAGELSESPVFALWDAVQCGVAAFLATAAPRIARRRA